MEEEIAAGFARGLITEARESYSRFWQKRRLRKMLKSPKYEWRSLKELSAAIGVDEAQTKNLLVQINARPQAGSPDMWGLEKRIGAR